MQIYQKFLYLLHVKIADLVKCFADYSKWLVKSIFIGADYSKLLVKSIFIGADYSKFLVKSIFKGVDYSKW